MNTNVITRAAEIAKLDHEIAYAHRRMSEYMDRHSDLVAQRDQAQADLDAAIKKDLQQCSNAA